MSNNKKSATDETRVDLDIRPVGPWRKNYDYGEGLYFGNMDRFKSVKDFLEHKKKKSQKRHKRKKLLAELLLELTRNG